MRSERTTLVKKDRLVDTITKNMQEHRGQFLKAQEKYREQAIALFDKRLAQARDGGVIEWGASLPEPVDYTEEYRTALARLDWEISDEVELDHEEFAQLVLNQWSWARHFAASTQSYLAG